MEDICQHVKPSVPIFWTYDDGYIVRGMTLEDAKIVENWHAQIGTVTPFDLKIALNVFPPGEGFYIGEYQGEVVSSAVRLPWGNRTYYGSHYYVEPRFRGRGFGTRLRDQVAFEHVGENRLCIDAASGAVAKKNAEKFNYVASGWFTKRLLGVAEEQYNVNYKANIILATDVPFDDLIVYDNKNFISKDNPIRRTFLKKLIQVPNSSSYVAVSDAGEILGFGNRRPAVACQPHCHVIGPLYADNPEIAEALLARLCQDVPGGNITMHVCSRNEAMVAIAEKFNFKTLIDDDVRMHVNGNPDEYKSTVHCLTSIYVCGF